MMDHQRDYRNFPPPLPLTKNVRRNHDGMLHPTGVSGDDISTLGEDDDDKHRHFTGFPTEKFKNDERSAVFVRDGIYSVVDKKLFGRISVEFRQNEVPSSSVIQK